MSVHKFTRRRALGSLATLVAGAPMVHGQGQTGGRSPALAPIDELVNVLEFEEMAKLNLEDTVYSTIAGSDRHGFEHITFRPRMLVPSAALDLTTELFGQEMFSPILVGPISQQEQFHPEGELAMVRGAASSQTAVVVSSRSSRPIRQIGAEAKTTLWYQVYEEDDTTVARNLVAEAIEAGCKVICITVGGPRSHRVPGSLIRPNWPVVDTLRQNIQVPVLLKGVMTEEDAEEALQRGVQGLVVSNGRVPGQPTPIGVLASIIDVVDGRLPVLIDGSFRRGSDVVKALALGAQAALIGRPVMWGLAAYGADGVRAVLQMLQTEIARSMTNMGKPTLKVLDRNSVKIHSRPTF